MTAMAKDNMIVWLTLSERQEKSDVSQQILLQINFGIADVISHSFVTGSVTICRKIEHHINFACFNIKLCLMTTSQPGWHKCPSHVGDLSREPPPFGSAPAFKHGKKWYRYEQPSPDWSNAYDTKAGCQIPLRDSQKRRVAANLQPLPTCQIYTCFTLGHHT